MLSEEKIEQIANEVGAPTSRYFPYWRTTVDLCRAIEAAVLEAQGKQELVAFIETVNPRDGSFRKSLVWKKHPKPSSAWCTEYTPLYAAPVVPPDMAMVPREATEAMLDAAMNRYKHVSPEAKARYTQMHRENFRCDYKAMIAAAEGK